MNLMNSSMVLVIQRLPITKKIYNQKEYDQNNNQVNIRPDFNDARLDNEFTNNETNQNRK